MVLFWPRTPCASMQPSMDKSRESSNNPPRKVKGMRTREQKQKGVYDVLDRLEKEKPQCVHHFWRCVFKHHILQMYPTLQLLRNSLLDGSFEFYENCPDVETQMEKSEGKEEKGKKKKNTRKRSNDDRSSEDSDDPGPSSASTPTRKKRAKKPSFSTPVKKGEKAEMWTWPIYKTQLPVNCGDKKGTLYRDKLPTGSPSLIFCYNLLQYAFIILFMGLDARYLVGEKCILSQGCWFTTSAFEKFGGKERCKNWKFSIRCRNTPLKKLIENMKELFPVISAESSSAGSRGKCIRTEESWFTLEEFVNQEPTLTDGHWKKDILCHGKTLNFLLKMAQKNDDVCYVCHSEGDLVCCDECPRAFHSHCHLPAVYGESPGEWICTFCVLRTSQQWRDSSSMTEHEAFNAPVSQYRLHCHYLLLCVHKEDTQRVFVEDPRKTVSRYSQFISQPMWLDRIKLKLESDEYQTVKAFVSDFQLIFSNCSTFNKDIPFSMLHLLDYNDILLNAKRTLADLFQYLREVFQEVRDKKQLAVRCGKMAGCLHRIKYDIGENCILCRGKWYSPTQFEVIGGKRHNKKWKFSIYYMPSNGFQQVQLLELIKVTQTDKGSANSKAVQNMMRRSELMNALKGFPESWKRLFSKTVSIPVCGIEENTLQRETIQPEEAVQTTDDPTAAAQLSFSASPAEWQNPVASEETQETRQLQLYEFLTKQFNTINNTLQSIDLSLKKLVEKQSHDTLPQYFSVTPAVIENPQSHSLVKQV
ncbi:Nuclear body protein SP140 [Anabarilius grahami]|uniref:Nuclear body protein SP140 n=1 Tax=Anabarilius grahami TaxID=495550 RepID=A0A3N0Y9E7_ANAGA|nr:Nuclear body protein SP140 [Anabarilius grahami]